MIFWPLRVHPSFDLSRRPLEETLGNTAVSTQHGKKKIKKEQGKRAVTWPPHPSGLEVVSRGTCTHEQVSRGDGSRPILATKREKKHPLSLGSPLEALQLGCLTNAVV